MHSSHRRHVALDRAHEIQSRVLPRQRVGSVEIATNRPGGLATRNEDRPPHNLGFQNFEERLNHRVIITKLRARHLYLNAMLPEHRLTLEGTVMTTTVGMANEASRRPARRPNLAKRCPR